jgi:hypothetical protein
VFPQLPRLASYPTFSAFGPLFLVFADLNSRATMSTQPGLDFAFDIFISVGTFFLRGT